MKITNFILSTTLLITLAHPSDLKAQNLKLGVKVGANMDKTQGKNLQGKFQGYFLGGAYVGLGFGKINIQAEPYFTQSGLTTGDNFYNAFGNYVKDGVSNTIKNRSFRMSELSIPVLVGVNILPKLLWIQAGPQYTNIVSIKDKDDILKETKDVFKNGYISGVVGLWVELPFSLNAGARYVFGLSNRNNTAVSEKWTTGQLQLHVGYSFMK